MLTLATALLLSVPALSLLEPAGSGQCEWVRVEVGAGQREVLARFFAPCNEVSITWNASGTRALLRTESSSGVPSFSEFEVASRRRVELPLPPRDRFIDVAGYDAKDDVLLATLEWLPDDVFERLDAGHLRVRGVSYALPDVGFGAPALAHGYRLSRGAWEKTETRATVSEACDTPGVAVLDTWRALVQPRASARLVHLPQGRARVEGTRFEGPLSNDFDEDLLEAPLSFSGRVLAGPAAGAPLHIEVDERFVLVEGGGVHLFDRHGALLFGSATALSASFWP